MHEALDYSHNVTIHNVYYFSEEEEKRGKEAILLCALD